MTDPIYLHGISRILRGRDKSESVTIAQLYGPKRTCWVCWDFKGGTKNTFTLL